NACVTARTAEREPLTSFSRRTDSGVRQNQTRRCGASTLWPDAYDVVLRASARLQGSRESASIHSARAGVAHGPLRPIRERLLALCRLICIFACFRARARKSRWPAGS